MAKYDFFGGIAELVERRFFFFFGGGGDSENCVFNGRFFLPDQFTSNKIGLVTVRTSEFQNSEVCSYELIECFVTINYWCC